MHFSWSKTPFPGQIECFVAVLLTSFQKSCRIFDVFRSQILGGRPSKSYTHFITPVVLMFFYCFYKWKKFFFVFFYLKINVFNIYAFDWCHFWWPWSTFEGHFSLGCHFHVHFSYPWHAFASHCLPELLVVVIIITRQNRKLTPV